MNAFTRNHELNIKKQIKSQDVFLRDVSFLSGFLCTYRKIRHSELSSQFANNYNASILLTFTKEKKYYALKNSISKFKYESTHYIGNTLERASERSRFGY